jgi:hypothetical protein
MGDSILILIEGQGQPSPTAPSQHDHILSQELTQVSSRGGVQEVDPLLMMDKDEGETVEVRRFK